MGRIHADNGESAFFYGLENVSDCRESKPIFLNSEQRKSTRIGVILIQYMVWDSFLKFSAGIFLLASTPKYASDHGATISAVPITCIPANA